MDSVNLEDGPKPATQLPSATWSRALAQYREPALARSLLELLITLVPFIALWAAMWAALSVGYWLALIIALPAAAFLVRLFMIQHDCGHGAFFRRRLANDWLGRVLGVLTLTPYDFWRQTHARHHATSGNLDRRGMGDITTLTVDEYLALSPGKRLGYRLYRHPLVMFGLGPAYLFILQHRLPVGLMRDGWRPWGSTLATNCGIAAAAAAMIWLVGLVPFLLVHLPITVIAGTIGVWLFYVQHQYEDAFWRRESNWTQPEAALYGSSHYDLPGPLRWVTANIGIHHVHHLSSRIPYYRLPEVLRDHPELAEIGRLSLFESIGCARRALWDHDHQRLIPIGEIRRASAHNR